ncbi:DUF1206 domain-containing protein [Zobellia alginiliquefaciens]|uniref:DUF1206 domain-containing protein n=1 Tax=Zobellia alginiliquefaciens TaxID=3032586 RepID=UPI0023E41226|nr:DUF1206 domain-containing protein [Zobellia alginiliquefaciens]
MNDKIKQVAYVGFAAKGAVYAITGILAFLAAFNLGGQKAGKFQVIEFLEKQPFGNVLLGALGLGLISYALWRFVQSIQDPENMGSDGKAMVKRISFFISGLIYLALGIFAIVDIFYEPNSGSGSSSSFLSGDIRTYAFIGIGAALAGKGLYQFIKVYKGNFLKKFNLSSLSNATRRKFIKNMGYIGLIARGIMTSIIAYFFLKAGFNLAGSDSSEMKGTSEAFQFIQQNSSGPWLMGVVAAGLVCYGVYMFTMARYRQFDD